MAPRRGSGWTEGVVSGGRLRDAAGGPEGAQPGGLGPRVSPVVCYWGRFCEMLGV